MNDCFVDSLPDEIENLKSLKVLALGVNNLKSLPNSIIHLDSLSVIDLSNNSFNAIPGELSEMKNLRKADLSNRHYTFEIQSRHWQWPFPIHINKIDYLMQIGAFEKLLSKASIRKVYISLNESDINKIREYIKIQEYMYSIDLFNKIHW